MSASGPGTWVPPGTNGATTPGVAGSQPWLWRDPRLIPPRPWLLGTTLLRGYTTLLGSPGGVGKTAWAVAAAMAVITGRRDILDLFSFVQGVVWFITLEDDQTELERRVAAAMMEHNIKPADITGRLIITGGDLKLVAYASRGGLAERTPEADDVEQFIKDNNVILCVIDPLVKAHSVNGNANEDMDVLISVTNEIARATNCALLLPCHFRKGSDLDSDGRDAFRGASSLVDGSRIAVGMLGMTKQEGAEFGVTEDDTGRYVRMVNSKANMTPKAEATDWYELVSIQLGNTAVDPTYPKGDSVQAVRHWQAPQLFDGMDLPAMTTIFARLADPAQVFHPVAGNNRNWAGTVIMAEAGKSREQAKRILKLWTDSGALVETTYKNKQREERIQLVPDHAKVAAILASMAAAHHDR